MNVDRVAVNDRDVLEYMFANGWTDGLPVVPPTPDRVAAMLAGAGRDADEVIGSVPARKRVITVEVAAVNAVLAGCEPDYFPIVLAGVEGILDPAFNIHTASTSTGGAAVAVIVSGPMGAEVGMNSGTNILGAGNRANATIGRAVRLVVTNGLGSTSGVLDASSIGHPGKFTLCFAEAEPDAPWAPLRVEEGYALEDTTVTVMSTEGPRQVANHHNGTPEGVLMSFAATVRMAGSFIAGRGGAATLLFGPEHALAMTEAGWTKERTREFVMAHSRITREELIAAGVTLPDSGQDAMQPGPDGKLATIEEPSDLVLVTGGGHGAGWSAILPTWAGARHSRWTTRRVRPCGEALPDCGPDACVMPWMAEDTVHSSEQTGML